MDWEGKQYDPEGILLKGIGAMPKSYDLMVALGAYYRNSGNLTRAIYFFNQALSIKPGNSSIQQEIDAITKK